MYVCMYGQRTSTADDSLGGLGGEGGHHGSILGHRTEYHRCGAHHLHVCMYVCMLVVGKIIEYKKICTSVTEE